MVCQLLSPHSAWSERSGELATTSSPIESMHTLGIVGIVFDEYASNEWPACRYIDADRSLIAQNSRRAYTIPLIISNTYASNWNIQVSEHCILPTTVFS